MGDFELDEEMFRDFQEGLEDLNKLKQNPDDELERRRFEKKWGNHSVRDVLELFVSLEPDG